MSARLLCGDVRTRLAELPAASVHACITSPPYYALRSYLPAEHPDKELEIGSEATPEAYVAGMVAVMAEVWRVLRPDGTLWVNISDSWNAYNGNAKQGGPVGLTQSAQRPALPAGHGLTVKDLKQKDLIGVPWLLAQALRAPRYLGAIAREGDRIWLAAMIDAEGCLFIHKRKSGQQYGDAAPRKSDTYSPGLEVANTSYPIVQRCYELTGKGSISTQTTNRRQPLYRWSLRADEARDLLTEVYPYLIGKQQQARITIGAPTSGERAEAAHAGLMLLHHGSSTEVDFPAPKPMYGPAWYWRDVIIWAKPNPMPASVTDRTTPSHEYVLLFAKQRRYFYDAVAIREPAKSATTKMPDGWDTGEGAHGTVHRNGREKGEKQRGHSRRHDGFNDRWDAMPRDEQMALGANKRSVWTIATQGWKEAHYATYPERLVEPMILASTSAHGVCGACGAPWARLSEREYLSPMVTTGTEDGRYTEGRNRNVKRMGDGVNVTTTGWHPACACAAPVVPATILDPFVGSGTTLLVALRHGRHGIGIDLDARSIEMARRRITNDAPLLNSVAVQS